MEIETFEKQRKIQWDILTRYDKYISDTHTKTSIILTIQILFAGATATNYLSASLFLAKNVGLNQTVSHALPLYFILTSIFLVWKCIGVVSPFLASGAKPSDFFFLDVCSMNPRTRLTRFETLDDEVLEDLFVQVQMVASGLTKKMKSLQSIYSLIRLLQLAPAGVAFFFIGVMA